MVNVLLVQIKTLLITSRKTVRKGVQVPGRIFGRIFFSDGDISGGKTFGVDGVVRPEADQEGFVDAYDLLGNLQ